MAEHVQAEKFPAAWFSKRLPSASGKTVRLTRLRKTGNILAGRAIKYHWDSGSSHTDGNTIAICERSWVEYSDPLDVLATQKADNYHEVGHVKFSDFTVVKEKGMKEVVNKWNKQNNENVKALTLVKDLLNISEDDRINNCMATSLPGIAEDFYLDHERIYRRQWANESTLGGDYMKQLIAALAIKVIIHREPPPFSNDAAKKLYADTLGIMQEAAMTLNTKACLWKVIEAAAIIEKKMKSAEDRAEKTDMPDFVTQMQPGDSEGEDVDITTTVEQARDNAIEKARDKEGKEGKGGTHNKKKGEGEDEGGSSSKESGKDADEKDGGSGKDGDKKDEKEKQDGDGKKSDEEILTEMMEKKKEKLESDISDELPEINEEVDREKKDRKQDQDTKKDCTNLSIADGTTKWVSHECIDRPERYWHLLKKVAPLVNLTSRKLQNIIEAAKRSRKKMVGGQTRGKLNGKRLIKALTFNNRIFKQRKGGKALDVVFSVIVDRSGSMGSWGSNKTNKACEAVLLFCEVLNQLGIPFEVQMFGAAGDTVQTWVPKPFDAEYERRKFKVVDDPGGCMNNDGASIHYAMTRLNNRPEQEKFLLVTSDGMPSQGSSWKGESMDASSILHSVLSSYANDNIIGIGIDGSPVKQYYKRSISIENTEDLPTEFLKLIQRTIMARVG